MDISDKKTALDDSASIYQRRKEKSDRLKWKELKGAKAKWEHFKAYYLLKTFIWVCVIALATYGIYEFVKPEKERVVFVAILDSVVLNDETEELQKGFEAYLGIDTKTQETRFDNSLFVSNRLDGSGRQVLTTYSFAGEIDVLIAPKSVLQEYAGAYLKPLSEQLPADLYEQLSNRFCYAVVKDDFGNVIEGSEQPFGLIVTDLLEISPYCREPIALAICGNSKNKENAEAFIRYLLTQMDGKSKEE